LYPIPSAHAIFYHAPSCPSLIQASLPFAGFPLWSFSHTALTPTTVAATPLGATGAERVVNLLNLTFRPFSDVPVDGVLEVLGEVEDAVLCDSPDRRPIESRVPAALRRLESEGALSASRAVNLGRPPGDGARRLRLRRERRRLPEAAGRGRPGRRPGPSFPLREGSGGRDARSRLLRRSACRALREAAVAPSSTGVVRFRTGGADAEVVCAGPSGKTRVRAPFAQQASGNSEAAPRPNIFEGRPFPVVWEAP
jgi:hypothetical protein